MIEKQIKTWWTMEKAAFALLAACCMIFGMVADVAPVRAEEARNVIAIQAIGSGEIEDTDTEKARELAIFNSLADAVNQVANGLVPQEGMVPFFTELNQAIFNDVQSYVQGYRVIDEWMTETDYNVMVDATVSVDAVKKSLADAGVIRTRKTLPRLLFLVSEQKTIDAVPVYWWDITDRTEMPTSELELTRQFRDADFSISRHEDIPIPSQWTDIRQSPELTDEQALRLGTHSSAQIVIAGTANVSAAGFTRDRKKEFSGVINLRAIRIDTGEQIAATNQSGTITEDSTSDGNTKIVTLLATLAAKDLAQQLMDVWPKIAQNPTRVMVTVKEVDDLALFFKFRQAVDTMPDVTALMLASLEPGQSTLRIDYKGDSRTLAEKMVENIYEGVAVSIQEIKTGQIILKLIPVVRPVPEPEGAAEGGAQ